MTRTTRINTTLAAAVAAVALVAVPAIHAQQNQSGGDAGQALEQLKEKQRQEIERQGSRTISVQEKAVYGLAELPPELMNQAFEQISTDPSIAKIRVLQIANILQLLSALGDESQEAQDLQQQARELRDVALKIEFKELVTREELRQPFAKAALKAAAFQQASAKKGIENNDEEQTGYSLKGAGAYLTVAHVFAGKSPSAQVSRAAYDASTLGEQIIQNAQPTTYASMTGDTRSAGRGQDQRGPQGQQDQDGRAQTAGGQQGGQMSQDKANIPQEAEKVVQDLKTAIGGVSIEGGQGQREGRQTR